MVAEGDACSQPDLPQPILPQAADGAAKGGRAAGSGRAGRGGGPSLTPAYAAKAQARVANPADDAQAANCLPPGLPAIMNQPYPMEFLLTPGKVTIVIEAYTQVRHIYTDGRPHCPRTPTRSFMALRSATGRTTRW